MNDEWTKQYDVFISYAHADAEDGVRKKAVLRIKEEIETALKGVTAPRFSIRRLFGFGRKEQPAENPSAFLDSEALKWGMDWNSRITECISHCSVFVYLLSPNYLRSEYCQRERLIWARQESEMGRLNQSTRPIYYIQLPEAGDPSQKKEIEEHLICQTNAQPFFESLEQVRNSIVSERIEQIRTLAADIKEQIAKNKNIQTSPCTIFQGFNPYFVGRLKELADLNTLICERRNIPVISGSPGVGKSELAIAYAFAYAEVFPQGRFMIPMQDVTSWTEALSRMVDQIKLCLHGESLMSWGFPEDFDKRKADERRRITWDWLWRRAQKGPLLLLLDNLDEMDLLSDHSLRELSYQQGVPDNLRIIATTRQNRVALPGGSIPVLFDLDRDEYQLKETDALELFCRIGENRFPFARWPMLDGKILLDDDVPPEEPPSQTVIEKTRKEYDALKKIIERLDCHAWSLDIVAGFMAENFEHYTFQAKLAGLDLIGKTRRGEGIQSPESLLDPTIKKLLDFDRIAENLGQHILLLAAAASFFPPEQIPLYALEGIWEQEFGNEEISYNDGQNRAFTRLFALEQLKAYRIVNGEGELLKMHRLTREVLQNRLSEEEKVESVGIMRKYLDEFHEKTPLITAMQILPWIKWAMECLEKLESTHNDSAFLQTCVTIIDHCWHNFLHTETRPLLNKISRYSEKINDDVLAVNILWTKAMFDADFKRYEQAEQEYRDAIGMQKKLVGKDPERFKPGLANLLWHLAGLHADFHHLDQAEQEYRDSVEMYKELAAKDPDRFNPGLAGNLEFLGNLYLDLGRFKQAEQVYQDAVKIFRELGEKDPERFKHGAACILGCLANLHRGLHQFAQAEKEYQDAIKIFRELADKDYLAFKNDLARSLCNYALLRKIRGKSFDFDLAEKDYQDAIKIFQELDGKNPDLFKPDLAIAFRDYASLHHGRGPDFYVHAEQEFKKAIDIYRELDGNQRADLKPDLANTLCGYARLHRDRGPDFYDQAEKEFEEAHNIYRALADKNPERFKPGLAMTLGNYALLHKIRGWYDQAEQDYKNGLNIYRELVKNHCDDQKADLAMVLCDYVCFRIEHCKPVVPDQVETDFRNAFDIYNTLDGSDRKLVKPVLVDALCHLAGLHGDLGPDFYVQADKEYRDAIKIQRELVQTDRDSFSFGLAGVLCRYVCFRIRYCKQVVSEQVETDFTNAFDIYNTLNENDRKNVKPVLADALCLLACLHRDRGPEFYDQADKEYQEAIKIQRELVEKEPERFISCLAWMLCEYVILETGGHLKTSRHRQKYQARKHCEEALGIYNTLNENDREGFKPVLADALCGLAGLHRDLADFEYDEMADKEYREAIKIQRELVEKDPERFESGLAMMLSDYAILNRERRHFDQAEEYFKEALDIYRKQVKNQRDDPAALAITLCNYAILHRRCQKWQDRAEKEFDEAITIYEQLEKDAPDVFYPPYLAWMLDEKQPDRISERAFRIALQYPDLPVCNNIIQKAASISQKKID